MKSSPEHDGGIGILLLDEEEPHVLGDPGHQETFNYRIVYRRVPGASIDRVLNRDETLNNAFVSTARELQVSGVRGLSGCCGHFVHFQDVVAHSVSVPVVMSSLLQVPAILVQMSSAKRVGILIGSSDRQMSVNAALARFRSDRLLVQGVFKTGGARSAFCPDGSTDAQAVKHAVTKAALNLVRSNRDIGAILLESSFFAPYSGVVRKALGLPVFDFVTLIDSLYRSTHHPSYLG